MMLLVEPTSALERKHRGVLPRPEHIHESLAHKQPNCDTDRNSNHSSSDINAIPLSSDTTCLGQTGLEAKTASRTVTGDRFE